MPQARDPDRSPKDQRVITFLGIELDTAAMMLRLPEEKLVRLQAEIARWKNRRACTKQELQSLTGQLQHACCVVRPRRTFLRRMFALLKGVKRSYHNVRLNTGFRSDLLWWATFLPLWNGVSMMARVSSLSHTLTSDTSGSWGCGAYSSEGEWFQLKWPEAWSEVHITVKELLPIVIAVALWGNHWENKVVRCRCDNAAVVAVVNSGTSKCDKVMHLLRSAFFTARHNITLMAEHIRGVDNHLADALSHDDHHTFLSQLPEAKRMPVTIPQELIQALVLQHPDWASINWTTLLRACSPKAWQNQPRGPTRAARLGTSSSASKAA